MTLFFSYKNVHEVHWTFSLFNCDLEMFFEIDLLLSLECEPFDMISFSFRWFNKTQKL